MRVRTSDPDEAARAFEQVGPGIHVEPLRGQPFECDLQLVTFGPLRFDRGLWPGGARMTSRSLGERHVLAISGGGSTEIEHGGHRVPVAPGRSACIGTPGRSVSTLLAPGFTTESVSIEPGELEAHIATLMGRSPPACIAFEPFINLEDGRSGIIVEVASVLRGALNGQGISALLFASLCDSLLTAVLTTLRHSASPLLAPGPRRVAPGCVRLAEEFIAAHATEAISLADIVRAAGVPARSLQAAFRAARGTSPIEFLRRRRFDLARQRLLNPEPSTTVRGVAMEMGFSNPGRFSVEYRQLFREAPRDTLLRGVRSTGCPAPSALARPRAGARAG
jgi:AraC-like DNA-binding protein